MLLLTSHSASQIWRLWIQRRQIGDSEPKVAYATPLGAAGVVFVDGVVVVVVVGSLLLRP